MAAIFAFQTFGAGIQIRITSERAQENGSARFQRAASGILAGRRAKVVGPADFRTAVAFLQSGGAFRQDAGKDTLEAYAPIFLRAASGFCESDGRVVCIAPRRG